MILRAAWVWLGPEQVLAPGEIVVERGRIVAVRKAKARASGIERRVLLPGWVNAHVHLQLGPLPSRPQDFVSWIAAVIAAGTASTPQSRRERGRQAMLAFAREGVSAVGEIDSTGESVAVLREVKARGRCYQEVLGFDLAPRAARALVGARRPRATRHCRSGFSPHAPYSTSAALFRAAAAAASHISVHVAEIAEEVELLQRGSGALRDLLEGLGRMPPGWRPPRCSSVAWLERLGVLSPHTLLVHAQHLQEGDEERIRSCKAPIAVCPGTIAYFGRTPPPVPRWLAAGIPVALGSDSLASNSQLSMLHELRLARRLWPELATQTLFAMATQHGAAALGCRGQGRIAPGLVADLVEIRGEAEAGLEALLDSFLDGKGAAAAVRAERTESGAVETAAWPA